MSIGVVKVPEWAFSCLTSISWFLRMWPSISMRAFFGICPVSSTRMK
jgi:hypothetical protein